MSAPIGVPAEAAGAPLLEVSLRHRFPGPAGFALSAEFAAPVPGVTALFGPSGCGKSSVLAAVAGLLRPQGGRIALAGRALFDAGRGIDVAAERRRCGVVFQDARLFPHLSVAGNLRYGARRAPRGAAAAAGFEEVVALLGIAHLLQRRPAALSGGERQRVALGRALLSRPDLLLMDEPLAALDAARKAELLPFLARLRDATRLPVLLVTHALDEVDALADTLVLMQEGRVLASGPVEALSLRADLPLLWSRGDAGAVLRCAVLSHEGGLTRLGFPGGELLVPRRDLPSGGPPEGTPEGLLRVRVRARDVSVAVEEPRGVSVRNVLPALLERVEPGGPGEAVLRLRLGPSALLARVTAEAVSRLDLAPGRAVWAMVKSMALGPAGPDGRGA